MLVVNIHLLDAMALLIILGLGVGVLSGLLGIGGGVLVVPTLLMIFHLLGINSSRVMQYAISTSFGVMVLTSAFACYFHSRMVKYNYHAFFVLVPGVLIGICVGAAMAHYFTTVLMQRIFSVFLCVVCLKMIFLYPVERDRMKTRLPLSMGLGVGSVIGMLSGLLGIGGGTLTVPFLLQRGYKYHTSVLVSLTLTWCMAVVGASLFMYLGYTHQPAWPGFIGYVNVYMALCIAVGAVPGALIATKVSHRLPRMVLRRIFAVFILVIAVHMWLLSMR